MSEGRNTQGWLCNGSGPQRSPTQQMPHHWFLDSESSCIPSLQDLSQMPESLLPDEP